MKQKIYFSLVNVRKYLRVDKVTGKSEIVPVTNRNALTVERHMELLNLNDEEHIYLECIEDDFENYNIESDFWDTYSDILIL